jgi:hypothetical protein
MSTPLLPNEGTLYPVNLTAGQIDALLEAAYEAGWYVQANRYQLDTATETLRWHQARIIEQQVRAELGELPTIEEDR